MDFEIELGRMRAKLIQYEEDQKALEERLVLEEEKMHEMLTELKEAKREHAQCLKLNEDKAACNDWINQVKILEQNYIKLDNENINPLHQEISDLRKKARTLKRKLKQITDNVEENAEIIDRYKKRLRTLRNEALEEYGIYGSLEGFTTQILFESNWKQQIEYAKRINPYSKLHIAALPISKSIIHIEATAPISQKINMPASLMYASVPGFTDSGNIESVTPSGKSIIDNLDASVKSINSMISGVSGKIVLSLVGSCEFTDENNKLKNDIDINQLTAHVTINTINEYPMIHERRHKVHFRAFRFAEEIEKRTEEGGFFHTNSTHEIINHNFSDDDFKVEFDADSSEMAYTQQEQAVLTAEAKKEILNRVLMEIGTVSQLKKTRPLLPNFVPSGAGIIYSETECFGWQYCQVATFVIGVLDAIFGHKEAVSIFKSNNMSRVTYQYSAGTPSTYSFVTSFKPGSREL